MEIKTEIKVDCPSGFYCVKNGKNKCYRLNNDGERPYCELFYPFLDTDSKKNVLKCEQCLLAERSERSKL